MTFYETAKFFQNFFRENVKIIGFSMKNMIFLNSVIEIAFSMRKVILCLRMVGFALFLAFGKFDGIESCTIDEVVEVNIGPDAFYVPCF